MEKFKELCRKSQKELKFHVAAELLATHENVVMEDGYVFAQGKFPVLLVAHLDTVHKELPQKIIYNEKFGTLSSPQGIGGDDRCGVYMILEIIKKYHCSVLFCEDEENGCIGAKKFCRSELAKELTFNYIIEFDRTGDKDAVFYDCDNPKFTKFITKEFYEESYGSFSDISWLAPELECAAVNLSCGYYYAHSNNEYVAFDEMKRSIEEACKILERTTDKDRFEYIEREWTYYGGYNTRTNTNYIEKHWVYINYADEFGIEDWDDFYVTSKEEAIGKWCMNHSDLTFMSVIDIFDDILK